LFREGHSVVAEGFVRPFDLYPGDLATGADQHASLTAKAKESGCYFAAIEVLAKHDEVTPRNLLRAQCPPRGLCIDTIAISIIRR